MCELACIPRTEWGTTDQGPNLDDYVEERKLLQVISLNAGPRDGHSVKMEPMKLIPMEVLRSTWVCGG